MNTSSGQITSAGSSSQITSADNKKLNTARTTEIGSLILNEGQSTSRTGGIGANHLSLPQQPSAEEGKGASSDYQIGDSKQPGSELIIPVSFPQQIQQDGLLQPAHEVTNTEMSPEDENKSAMPEPPCSVGFFNNGNLADNKLMNNVYAGSARLLTESLPQVPNKTSFDETLQQNFSKANIPSHHLMDMDMEEEKVHAPNRGKVLSNSRVMRPGSMDSELQVIMSASKKSLEFDQMSMVADEDDMEPVGAAVHRGFIEEEKKSEEGEKCDISLDSGRSKEAEEEKQ